MKRPVLLGLLLLSSCSTEGGAPDVPKRRAHALSAAEAQAKSIFRRLTGTGLLPSDPRLATMVEAIEAGRPQDAAHVATADSHFYSVTLRNWSAPWSSTDGAPDNEFDDLSALALGIVRDSLDARLLLTGNLHYEGTSGPNVPAFSERNNDHFRALEDQGVDLSTSLRRVDAPAIATPEHAGLLTTRGFAKAYYSGGTNRRAVVFSILQFLCTPQLSWRDPNLPENFIRRDVHRDPPSNYQTECRTCHAPMDGMSGAFAHFDFDAGTPRYYGPFNIAPKYNINVRVFPDGYSPSDDSWTNYATRHHNLAFGWHGAVTGRGIQAFGEMLAGSDAFASCMVKTAFQATCHREPQVEDQSFLEQTASEFRTGGYQLKSLFETVAISNQCS